jgi:hypothetical protein
MTKTYIPTKAAIALLILGAHLFGCSKDTETSVGAARQYAPTLVETSAKDVDELRKGLPEGATHLAGLYQGKVAPKDDLPAVRRELERAREKVIDLRVAKSTFFALVEPDGTVLRTDRVPDLMSGKNLFTAYPVLKAALDGKPVEGRGSMLEAAAVKGRKDGQLVMAVPVSAGGNVVGVYASGWSWTAYAYRLENALRSEIRSKIKNVGDKEPLVYVYVIVDDAVYGAPVSPQVNADAIQKLAPLTKATEKNIYATPLEITGRSFGLAIQRAPSLGANVAIALLWSET